eukprot:CAMPEP_0115874044 /NCGR_PEP_ID=MMETSP0287-20121206/24326_1 /TAXON_ID=412157 /ORGANISM="Chrysochromulina rotalis, Strain UIO044" /LENGTH=80 /DNA_ID=CAMNT_0003329159 /DNA_START=156 /DNA_END=398 /DNA_ORIENTATION=-
MADDGGQGARASQNGQFRGLAVGSRLRAVPHHALGMHRTVRQAHLHGRHRLLKPRLTLKACLLHGEARAERVRHKSCRHV